ncbi:hypothetical protein [Roseinatronobacter sp. NSM]|uniref:hypothetical protein n=1 Tax=Roseinatronobacter sp. NSM TaxID=3457785 RepID=UPI004036D6B2
MPRKPASGNATELPLDHKPCYDSARAMHEAALEQFARPSFQAVPMDIGPEPDPHVLWLMQWRDSRLAWADLCDVLGEDDEATEAVYQERWRLFDLMTGTSPTTLSGVLAVICAIYEDARGVDCLNPPHEMALQNLILALGGEVKPPDSCWVFSSGQAKIVGENTQH